MYLYTHTWVCITSWCTREREREREREDRSRGRDPDGERERERIFLILITFSSKEIKTETNLDGFSPQPTNVLHYPAVCNPIRPNRTITSGEERKVLSPKIPKILET